MQADSSRSRVQVDQNCVQPEISSVEGRRVPAGPCSYNNNISIMNSLGGRHVRSSSRPLTAADLRLSTPTSLAVKYQP